MNLPGVVRSVGFGPSHLAPSQIPSGLIIYITATTRRAWLKSIGGMLKVVSSGLKLRGTIPRTRSCPQARIHNPDLEM